MFFPENADLFAEKTAIVPTVEPWKPRALDHDQWPPNYKAVYAWRIKQLAALRNNPEALQSAKAYYSTRPHEFIQHWLDTYNPRKNSTKWMPFVFFKRQNEFIDFLYELDNDNENGLVEKCRDIGATWLVCAFSVWAWLFIKDDATGWGSRKQDLVDKIGDADSIFEKMRLLIKRLPDVWLPDGFRPRDHATYMKLINPANGSTITGESGDNIGRGGRKKRYIKDESAHYERPELIEAALGDNTDIQLDISSVNGVGNVFHRRREAGLDWFPGCKLETGFTRVFIFDWRDHPEKTQAWYDARKAKAEREGMQHVFAQEVDRNYSAAIQNTIIEIEWIYAAVDAHLKIPYLANIDIPKRFHAGLDVADGGLDRNALALRQWIVLRNVTEWGARDPGVSTRNTINALQNFKGITLEYDSIGIGASVKSEYNRLVEIGQVDPNVIKFNPWNAGGAVVKPYENIIPDDDESLLNKDFFHNMKAQAWWSLRTRFYKTWRAVTFGDVYPPDELISLDGTMTLLHQLIKELAQPTRKTDTVSLKMIVDKKPNGTRSPNLADCTVQAYFPAPETGGTTLVGSYGA